MSTFFQYQILGLVYAPIYSLHLDQKWQNKAKDFLRLPTHFILYPFFCSFTLTVHVRWFESLPHPRPTQLMLLKQISQSTIKMLY